MLRGNGIFRRNKLEVIFLIYYSSGCKYIQTFYVEDETQIKQYSNYLRNILCGSRGIEDRGGRIEGRILILDGLRLLTCLK